VGGCAGLVLIEGERAVVDAQTAALRKLAGAARCDTVEGEALAPVRHAWMDLARVDDLGPDETLLTIHTSPSGVPEAMRLLDREATGHELALRAWACAGNGVVYGRLRQALTPQHPLPNPGEGKHVMASIQRSVLARWPATTLVAGNPEVERAARPWGADPEGLPMMRALKQRFDPAGVLQPGRFVGEI
jgi:glycolate oxidase FAD binding subunit